MVIRTLMAWSHRNSDASRRRLKPPGAPETGGRLPATHQPHRLNGGYETEGSRPCRHRARNASASSRNACCARSSTSFCPRAPRAPEQIGAVLPQHLEYMIGLEKSGVLFASGPLTAAQGQPAGDGLTILRAASAAEARKIASADPFVANSLRTFEVREWTVMEGSLGLTINFSDQSLKVV